MSNFWMCQIPIHSWITTRKQVRRLFAGPGSDMMMDKEGSESKKEIHNTAKCREPSLQNHMRPAFMAQLSLSKNPVQDKVSKTKCEMKCVLYVLWRKKNSFPFHGKIFNPIPSVEVPHCRSKRLWLKQASDSHKLMHLPFPWKIKCVLVRNEMTRSFISRH